MWHVSFKRFILCVVLLASFGAPRLAAAYVSPGAPNGYVNDFAHVFTSEEQNQLETKVRAYEVRSSNEIAVVTIPTTGDESIEAYAVKLFEEWGIGKSGKDNGVLLLLALQDRKLRIEVGYGLEPILTDAKSAALIRDVTPLLKAQDYRQAIYQLETGIQTTLDGGKIVSSMPPTKIDEALNRVQDTYPGFFVIGLVICGLFILLFMRFILGMLMGSIGYLFTLLYSLVTGRPRPKFKTFFGGIGLGLFRRGSGRGGFGGSSSFGGGRSGGGGSSGSW